jgi:hypothetical protein
VKPSTGDSSSGNAPVGVLFTNTHQCCGHPQPQAPRLTTMPSRHQQTTCQVWGVELLASQPVQISDLLALDQQEERYAARAATHTCGLSQAAAVLGTNSKATGSFSSTNGS